MIVETEDARRKINKFIKILGEKIFVVGNTYHPVYGNYLSNTSENSCNKDDAFKLLVLSAFYPHKNLEIINSLIPILDRKTKRKVVFYLTISESDFKNNFIVSENLINLGPQKVEDVQNYI